MLLEALISAIVDELATRAVTAVTSAKPNVGLFSAVIDKQSAANALRDHLRFVENWSSEIVFRDLLRSKKLAESFVDLECQLGQVQDGRAMIAHETRRVSSLLNSNDHVVVLGRPGAGKTTSMQRLALSALQRYKPNDTFTPVVLRLRELSGTETVLDRLAQIAAVSLVGVSGKRTGVKRSRAYAEDERRDMKETQRRALSAYFDSIRALVFLDGLDECPPILRSQVEGEINALMEHSLHYKIILTCRSADYSFSFPAQAYTILPLTKREVRIFAVKWLGTARASAFMGQLEISPYSGAEVVPITIAHLCAIFERRGEIPRQPRFVYQKIVRLLLEEWDEQRGIQRPSQYSGFEIDRKLEFLRRISYELTVGESRGSFTHPQLESAYLKSHELFGLPRAEYSRVAREIESHNGLILQSAFDRYEFAHKSIQEYLTAEYLLRLPDVPRPYFLNLGDELAIATGLSSRPELYVESITETLLSSGSDGSRARFASVFLGRLIVERPDLCSDEWLGWTLLTLGD
jgi:predicted NACHT family NTPase